MKSQPFIPLFFSAIAAVVLTACSDPSDNVHKSSTSAPQQPGAAAGKGGKDYFVRAESTIGFVGSKVTGSHTGGFKKFAGKISVADGKITGTPEIQIDMDSTWSDNERLTGHLKNADFFDVPKFPRASFTLMSVDQSAAETKITGNLNLHGVAKSISFPAQVLIGSDAVTIKSEFAINRRDFNINFPGKPNDLIRDNVVIKLDLKATPGAARPEDTLPN